MNYGTFEVDIVIPFQGALVEAFNILESLQSQTFKPSRTFLIWSNTAADHDFFQSQSRLLSHKFSGIGLSIELFKQSLYPGEARNVGLGLAKSRIIAFLDKNTIPKQTWLAQSLDDLESSEADVLLGSVEYLSYSKSGNIIIASTYGFSSRAVLPGSLLRLSALRKTGFFLPNLRAGEDLDWIYRLKLFTSSSKIRFSSGSTAYVVRHPSIRNYFVKWVQMYASSALVPGINNQLIMLVSLSSALIMLIAYTWNGLVAGWHEQSSLYIPNITKYTLLSLVTAYLFVRAYWVPQVKGAFDKGGLSLLDCPAILAYSFSLDLAKALGFAIFIWRLLGGRR